jgi:hypothetical protein
MIEKGLLATGVGASYCVKCDRTVYTVHDQLALEYHTAQNHCVMMCTAPVSAPTPPAVAHPALPTQPKKSLTVRPPKRHPWVDVWRSPRHVRLDEPHYVRLLVLVPPEEAGGRRHNAFLADARTVCGALFAPHFLDDQGDAPPRVHADRRTNYCVVSETYQIYALLRAFDEQHERWRAAHLREHHRNCTAAAVAAPTVDDPAPDAPSQFCQCQPFDARDRALDELRCEWEAGLSASESTLLACFDVTDAGGLDRLLEYVAAQRAEYIAEGSEHYPCPYPYQTNLLGLNAVHRSAGPAVFLGLRGQVPMEVARQRASAAGLAGYFEVVLPADRFAARHFTDYQTLLDMHLAQLRPTRKTGGCVII